jgi:hypothetical protein
VILVMNVCTVEFYAPFEDFGEFSEVVLDEKGLYFASCFLVVVNLSPEDGTVKDAVDV